ncbi:hypothetical protein V8E36_002184 [Tilletia maclaganii]
MTSLDDLPAELLTLIFQYLEQDRVDLLALSLVSKRLRQASLPPLVRLIDIQPFESKKKLEKLIFFLKSQQSAGFLSSIRHIRLADHHSPKKDDPEEHDEEITMENDASEEFDEDKDNGKPVRLLRSDRRHSWLLALGRPHPQRLARAIVALRIYVADRPGSDTAAAPDQPNPIEDALDYILQSQASRPHPALTILELHNRPSKPFSDEAAAFPNLSIALLAKLAGRWSKLKHFGLTIDLRDPHLEPRLTVQDRISDLLQQHPALEHLRLSLDLDVAFDEVMPSTFSGVELPQLQSCELKSGWDTDEALAEFLNRHTDVHGVVLGECTDWIVTNLRPQAYHALTVLRAEKETVRLAVQHGAPLRHVSIIPSEDESNIAAYLRTQGGPCLTVEALDLDLTSNNLLFVVKQIAKLVPFAIFPNVAEVSLLISDEGRHEEIETPPLASQWLQRLLSCIAAADGSQQLRVLHLTFSSASRLEISQDGFADLSGTIPGRLEYLSWESRSDGELQLQFFRVLRCTPIEAAPRLQLLPGPIPDAALPNSDNWRPLLHGRKVGPFFL